MTERGPITVGRIFYQVRMRKPLDEALRWYQQSKALESGKLVGKTSASQQPAINAAVKKVVEIHVTDAKGLMISGTGNSYAGKRMLPFFSYDFYTFEVRSATAQSANPFFDSIKRFEIEQTADFLSYIKNEVLKIDLIDEGVDYTDANLRDYIGSVRIPLRDLLLKGSLAGVFPVQDESRNACGYLNVKISIHDVMKVENNPLLQGAEGMAQARKATAEVVKQVAEALAMTKFEDIDLLLDMLFVKESSD